MKKRTSREAEPVAPERRRNSPPAPKAPAAGDRDGAPQMAESEDADAEQHHLRSVWREIARLERLLEIEPDNDEARARIRQLRQVFAALMAE